MITANYINEGATLIVTADGQRHGIPVTDDTQAFCEALFREINSANAIVDFFAWIVANCKIIHWPGGGHYPIEHAPLANKDGIPHLKAAMNKEGMYAQPLMQPEPDPQPEEDGPSDSTMQELATQYKFFEKERYRKDMTDAGREHLLPP